MATEKLKQCMVVATAAWIAGVSMFVCGQARAQTKIIIDSDNTMGVPRRDIDDGLTLLYLLGRQDVNILGITTTFGNSDLETVHANTQRFLKTIGREDIPLNKGAKAGAPRGRSPAAEFLAATAKRYRGQVTVLALGSLANLYGAQQIDPTFLDNVSIVAMGGITEPLIINGKRLGELNFTVDSEAAFRILRSQAKLTVLTGNLCRNAFFGPRDFARLAQVAQSNPMARLIEQHALQWRAWRNERQPTDGFFLWDLVPAVYLTNPELFEVETVAMAYRRPDLDEGLLRRQTGTGRGSPLRLARQIKNVTRLKRLLFDAWSNVSY